MQPLSQKMDLLSRLISASETRHKVISHNIANVNTPDYQRLDVQFEQALSRELNNGGSEGSAKGHAQPEIVHTPGLVTRADGNNVDIDREIGELNKNALLQQVWLQLMTTEISQMRTAIDGN